MHSPVRMASLSHSLPRICVALGFQTPEELSAAAEREFKDGSKFLEFRLDYLADAASGVEVMRSFRRNYPDSFILATCRHKQNAGYFKGSIEEQIKVLEGAGLSGAAALDLEIESAEKARPAIRGMRDAAPVFVSYHNFQGTPALDPVLRRLRRIPADAYKIAITASKPSHNLRLLRFAREHRELPLIALAMSEIGIASRVLAPSAGCLYTYAAPDGQEGTAPGQVPARVMRNLYRCEKLTKRSQVYGVIADPVGHSKSPLIHNRALQARRIDAVYLPFLVPGTQLRDWMELAAGLPVMGFSVTIPHKQKIMRYLDAIDPLAKRIGAVNTVWRKGGKWRGTNTDVRGIVGPLSRNLRLAHASVLIAGYGGAARAAAFALSDAGANVTITGRDLRKAQALAKAVRAAAVGLREAETQRYDALVHATPIGMFPKTEECLFRDCLPAETVFDMVYNPHDTLLIRRATEQGCSVIHGSEMFLEQAAAQFEIWTGESAPVAVMRSALEQK